MKSSKMKCILFLAIAGFFLLSLSRILPIISVQNIKIGTFVINLNSIIGIIQALNNLICVLLVLKDIKKGFIISIILFTLFILSNIITIVSYHSLAPLPGIFATTISIVMICVITITNKKILKSSLTDFVTQLKNKRQFIIDIENSITNKRDFYIAYFMIDNFRHIQDEYGLQSGDYILNEFGQILKDNIKTTDIYRINGSNFAALLYQKSNPLKTVENVIEKTKEEIVIKNSEFSEEDTEVSCNISVISGIAKYPEDALISMKLIKDADIALNQARKLESKICIFDKTLEIEMNNQIESEKLIKESLKNDYFYMVYQPQFDIETRKVRGFEALIRCKKPNGTIVSPVEFIPIAEKSNLILKIDNYVLKSSLREFKTLIEKTGESISLSVNISTKSISNPEFFTNVINILNETRFPPRCLELEITEYSLADSKTTIKNITQLRNIGIKIALDDFGSGYTAIAQLMKLPINTLKIDKSLIDDIENNKRNLDLIDSVIYMGHIMNCEVIAEGVEHENQLALLKNHKCNFVQGYVWGKPIDFENILKICE